MPLKAPQPMQPNPMEIANWQQGRGNARLAYTQQLARSNYGRAQATLGNQTAQRQMQWNQGVNRRQFDDQFIGRGIFRSGIRNQGLSDFYTQQNNDFTNLQNQYAGAMGQFGMTDDQAFESRNQALQNIDAQEYARRAALAAQIKGII
jgi:hypothetical protein